jgi:hypothetical protein
MPNPEWYLFLFTAPLELCMVTFDTDAETGAAATDSPCRVRLSHRSRAAQLTTPSLMDMRQ